MTERPKQPQALDWAINDWQHAIASLRVDTELIEVSKAAIRSTRAMLQSDLGTRLPGFELPEFGRDDPPLVLLGND